MYQEGFLNFEHGQSLLTKVDPCQRAWLEVNSQAIETNAKVLKLSLIHI